MNISELIMSTRSYRRYDESRPIAEAELREIVMDARNTPSAGNLQRIRFRLVTDPTERQTVFDTLAFAAYLKDFDGPAEGERPMAYIVLMVNAPLDPNLCIDIGITAEAILLSARARGIGGCLFRGFRKEKLAKMVAVDDYTPALVIALGAPKEHVVLTEAKNGEIKYYRDEKGTHYVPKRPLDELIL